MPRVVAAVGAAVLALAVGLPAASAVPSAPAPAPAAAAWAEPARGTAVPAAAAPGAPAVPAAGNPVARAQARYRIASTGLQDLWVDPVRGSDSATGADRRHALRTVTAAWARVPASRALTRGYRIQLVRGTYPASVLPGYWEHRWGTAAAPVVLTAADGPRTARLTGDLNVFDVRHLYLLGIEVAVDGTAFHCERCSYVLLRRVHLDGDARPGGAMAVQTLKANQSDHLYVEDSDLHGSEGQALDYVAVQHGHVVGTRLHDAGDWCAYVKGGSAYITLADDEIFDCGTGGFTAGQGSGLQYLVAPWLTYEAMDVRVVGTVVHDTFGAGLGVNGGFDVLLAYNTLYRVGRRSHVLEVIHGGRTCDGGGAAAEVAACRARLRLGGWGTDTDAAVPVPNRHVYVYDNVVLNPPGVRSAWQHLAVGAPAHPAPGTRAPDPAAADDDLRIAGNVVLNGGPDMPLGVGGGNGCEDANPTCNAARLRAENAWNTVVPRLDARLCAVPGSPTAVRAAVPVPAFTWTGAPSPAVPAGAADNRVARDRTGATRAGWGHPGAC